jgi:hypothetical protein
MLQIFRGRRRSAASQQYEYSAGSIINMSGFRFWIGTAAVSRHRLFQARSSARPPTERRERGAEVVFRVIAQVEPHARCICQCSAVDVNRSDTGIIPVRKIAEVVECSATAAVGLLEKLSSPARCANSVPIKRRMPGFTKSPRTEHTSRLAIIGAR